MTSQFYDMTSSSIFSRCFVSLVKFSYWSKFHVNIITGSGIITIFFYKGLTRNPKIGNTLVWLLPNIGRLRQAMDTRFGTNVSNKILLNAGKFQGYSSYRFWVIKGKPTGEGVKFPPPPPPKLGCELNSLPANIHKPYQQSTMEKCWKRHLRGAPFFC